MKKKLVLASVLLASTFVYADDFKLGYVDVERIMTTAKPALALKNALSSKYSGKQKSLQALNDNLMKEQNQMQAIAKKANSLDQLSATDKSSLEKLQLQFQKDQATFQQQYIPFQQSLQKSQENAMAILLGRANTILKGISEKGSFDLVLTSQQLVYAKPKYDLTDQVIKQLNDIKSQNLIDQLNQADAKPLTANSLQSLSGSSAK